MGQSRFDVQATYVDTPEGIFAADGLWFRTREADLERFAGPVLAHLPLAELIDAAGRWVRLGQTVALWGVPIALYALSTPYAVLTVLVAYGIAQLLRPLLVRMAATPALRLLQAVPPQALLYIVSLSAFGMAGAYAKVVVGVAAFVVTRWGLLDAAFARLFGWLMKRLYPIPMADQVLRSTIVRAAMRHRVSLPELDRIERKILEQLRS